MHIFYDRKMEDERESESLSRKNTHTHIHTHIHTHTHVRVHTHTHATLYIFNTLYNNRVTRTRVISAQLRSHVVQIQVINRITMAAEREVEPG